MGDLCEKIKMEIAPDVLLYRSADSRRERLAVYTELRRREKAGEGYALVVDGPALEVSDLDATLLITEPCHPLALLRRAGRCNRRGESHDAKIVVVGDPSTVTSSPVIPMTDYRQEAFLRLVYAARTPVPFDAEDWKPLVA